MKTDNYNGPSDPRTRPMRKMFYDQETHCVVCGVKVPPERVRFKAITCTPEHAKLRKAQLRAKTDQRECRYCRKPSTVAERAAFQRFRKWETKNPQEAFPAEFKQWKDEQEWQREAGEMPTNEFFTIEVAYAIADANAKAADLASHISPERDGEDGAEVRDSEELRTSLAD